MSILKRLLSICLISSLALSGCAYQIPVAEQPDQAAQEVSEELPAEVSAEVSSIDTSVMKPWINSNIMGIITDDVNPDLKDDFYINVNRDYLRTAKLRPGYSYEFPLYDASDMVRDRCIDILTDKTLEGRDAELTQGLYELFLDWDKRNEIGLTKMGPLLKRLKEVSTIEELNNFILTDEWLYPGVIPVTVGLGVNHDDSSLYQVNISSPYLSLNDSAEYEQLTANGDRQKEYNDETAGYILDRIGYSEEEIQKILDDRFSFETKLAGYMKNKLEWSDPASVKESINMVTLDDIKKMSPNYPLVEHMELIGYAESELINIKEPKSIEGLNELYNEDNLEEIKAYLLAATATSLMPYLDEEAYRTYQDCNMKLNGITEVSSDEENAYNIVRSYLNDNLSRLYVEKYLNPEIKEEITTLCQDCIDTYSKMLDEEEWLSEETRELAKNKLSKLTIRAVYPEKWDDDSMLSIIPKEEGGDYCSAINDLCKAKMEMSNHKINAKLDKDIWYGISILNTNAYYISNLNAINILPGFFCDATYRSDMSIEEKYGALGYTIGHEISHAFDTNGAQFDGDGNVKNWWTEEDYAAFTERSQKLIEYYDRIVPLDDGNNYNGQMVQGEVIADLAGIKCMLLMAGKIDGFDYDKFFRTYAHMWASVMTLSEVQKRIATDVHPLFYLRINTVLSQFDEFLETYDIKEGDGMYIAPEDRITVW
ncbi:MAG: M13 family metallopeptidase [Lachnospiraceae bacterium]|nr:M13 family metallopeptidase [Lachnospiraceae bacterium]